MVRLALAGLAATLLLGGAALGQNAAPAVKADDKPGPPSQRYRFSHSAEGVLRLDNETGQVTLCRPLNGGWVCNPAPEETAVLQVELKRKNDEVKKLLAQFAQLKQDVSRAEDSASDKDRSLQADIGRLQGAIDALKTEVTALAGKIVEAGKQTISQDERQSLVSRLALLEQDNSGLKGALDRLERENAELKKQIANAGKPSDLEGAVAQALSANEDTRRELAAAREQIAALQKRFADRTDRNAQQAEIERLKTENKELSDKMASLEMGNAALRAEIDALKPPPPQPKAEVPADKKDELKLPSREDMERARAALTEAWQRLMDMIGQLQKDMLGGKNEPPVRL